MIFLCVCIVGITIVVLFNYNKSFKQSKFRAILLFPHVKEEIRVILYTWNDSFMGNFCVRILDLIALKNNRIFYLLSHFIIFNVPPVIQTLFLINFAFLHGDLKYNIYLLPVSFFTWCISFIDYYFNTFITQSGNYIRAVLHMQVDSPDKKNHINNVIMCNINDLRCKLTDFGVQEGFTENDLSYLANKWLYLNHITIDFEKYLKVVSYLKYANLALRIVCWSAIVHYFYSANMIIYSIAGIFGRVPFRAFHASRPLLAQEARWVKPQHRQEFERTFPGLKGDHPIVVDPALKDENGFVPLYTQLTHGVDPANNPSKLFHPNMDIKNNQRPQHGVVPQEPTTVHEGWTDPAAIQGSAQVLQNPQYKANMAKHTYYPDSED
jgi:hypothetical protein